MKEPLLDSAELPDKSAVGKRTTKKFKPAGKGLELLRLAMNLDKLPSGLDYQKLALEEDLEVEISLSYRGHADDANDKAMKSLVQAAKHVDEDKLDVKFRGARTGKGKNVGKIYVSEKRGVNHINGFPDPMDMWSEMHEVMKHWIDTKQV